MIFLYFLNDLNVSTRFSNIRPLNNRTSASPLNKKIFPQFRFPTSKFVVKTVNVSLTFTENQHLVLFSPITKVSFERSKSEDFYTHYFIEVLACVMNFILTFYFETCHLETILIKSR